jgi:transcriptional regulator with XRE-family HTH domain
VWQHIYLREWREHRGLSTEGLAEKAGVSPGLVSQIENRKSSGSADSLEKLAKALEIDVGELFDVKPAKGGSVLRIFVADKDRDTARRLLEALSKDKS